MTVVAALTGGCFRQEIRTAIKPHRCDLLGCAINPGDRYLIETEYPGGDAGYADAAGHPVRMKVCRSCGARSFELATPQEESL